MSYILDALKKAESERERGVVPGLNSAQANQSTVIHYGSDQKPWWLVALVLGVLLAAVLVFWTWRQAAVGASTAPIAQPAAPVTPASPVSPVALSPVVPIPVPVQPPTTQPTLEAKVPVAPVQKPEPPARAPVAAPVVAINAPLQPAASTVAHVQTKAAPPPANPAQTATLAAAVPVAPPVESPAKSPPIAAPIRSATGGVPALNELPEALRRQIPALNISGGIYSDSPAEWTLIINDQILGKGSQVAPDVRLEEISASSAVFNFKGQRFRVDR